MSLAESRAAALNRWRGNNIENASGSRFADHRFPNTFGFENEFNRFADRTVAGESLRSVMGGLFYLGDGVAHCDREASAAHQGNIGKIIADIGDCRIGQARFAKDFFIGRHLERLFHINKLHLHFVRPAEQRGTLAAGNAASSQARGLRQGEALAIVRVEGLDFEGAAVGLREQGDAAVRHRSVDIHE